MEAKATIVPIAGRRVARDGQTVRDAGIVAQSSLSWKGGRALHEKQSLDDGSELRFSSDHHALFFGFRQPGYRSEIRIDGKLVLDGFSRDPRLTVQPALSEIVKNTAGGADEYDYLAVLLHPNFVLRSADASHIIGVELLPSLGRGDELSWQLAVAIREECSAGAPNGSLYVEAAAILLSLHLLRHHSNIERLRLPTVKGGLSHRQLRTVLDYMMDHLREDISLGQLATHVGLSESHFCRAFKVSTGFSPYQWLKQRRIERSQELMSGGTAPLIEIATACGFANQSHFTKAFRDAVGTSPAAWRRNRSL